MKGKTMDCHMLATKASANITNLALSKQHPERFNSMVRIVETALRLALKRQREAFLRESKN